MPSRGPRGKRPAWLHGLVRHDLLMEQFAIIAAFLMLASVLAGGIGFLSKNRDARIGLLAFQMLLGGVGIGMLLVIMYA